MHILLIHQAFTAINEPGGTRHAEFARYLAAHGHRVTVIASPVSYLTGSALSAVGQDGVVGVRVIRARAYSAHHRSFIHRLFAFISFMSSSFFLGLKVKNVDLSRELEVLSYFLTDKKA